MRPLLLCLTAMLVAAACDQLPGAEPRGDTWELTLVNHKSTVYGGSACTSQTDNQYCKTWVDDPYVFAGTLHRTYRWTLDDGKGSFSASDAAQSVDTVIVDLVESTGCGSYQLFFRTRPDSIYGTFLHTSDCHGAGNSGTFVGRP